MRRVSFLLCLLLLFTWSNVAYAHADLDHAEPKVGAEIKKSPDEIKIWFSDEIEPTFSTITVQNQSGSQIDNRDTHVDSHNPKLLIVSVPKLDAGVFTVTWKVTAKDTHRTHGDFKFTIKAAS